MKFRRTKDVEILAAEKFGVAEAGEWVREIFVGRGNENFRVPRDVLTFGIGVMLDNYEKARSDEIRGLIRRKVLHTREVMEAGVEIMKAEKSFGWNPYSVGTVTFLHDMGRFVQAHLGSFSDGRTGFDHAEAGAKLIAQQEFSEAMSAGVDMRQIVEAVEWHSKLEYTRGDPYGKFIRDADKLGIMEHYCDHIVDYLEPDGKATPGAVEAFKEGRLVLKSDMVTKTDIALSLLSWQFDFNYEATREIFELGGMRKYMEDEVRRMDEEVWKEIIDGKRS